MYAACPALVEVSSQKGRRTMKEDWQHPSLQEQVDTAELVGSLLAAYIMLPCQELVNPPLAY